jgi:hypothetical protein
MTIGRCRQIDTLLRSAPIAKMQPAMRIHVYFCAVLLLPLCADAGAAQQDQPSPEIVAKCIAQLGDDDFKLRQEATDQLEEFVLGK